jgi:hypothetical protein
MITTFSFTKGIPSLQFQVLISKLMVVPPLLISLRRGVKVNNTVALVAATYEAFTNSIIHFNRKVGKSMTMFMAN